MSEITAVPLRPIKKGVLPLLWAGIALALVIAVAFGFSGTEAQVSSAKLAAATAPADYLALNGKRRGVVTTASGLQYQVMKKADGPKPTAADVVLVDYEGRLTNGTIFDSTAQAGKPAVMPVAEVVPGFSEALKLMPKGSSYRFWIPPQLGYGARAAGPIPPNSVLVFDVTLHEMQPMAALNAAIAAGAVPPR